MLSNDLSRYFNMHSLEWKFEGLRPGCQVIRFVGCNLGSQRQKFWRRECPRHRGLDDRGGYEVGSHLADPDDSKCLRVPSFLRRVNLCWDPIHESFRSDGNGLRWKNGSPVILCGMTWKLYSVAEEFTACWPGLYCWRVHRSPIRGQRQFYESDSLLCE